MATSRALGLGLLALVALSGFSNADSNRPIDFLTNIEDKTPYSIFEDLYNNYASDEVKDVLNGTDVGGIFLVPNNNAFTSLLNYLKLGTGDLFDNFVNEVLKDHGIQDFPVEGTSETKNFTTGGGRQVELTFNENGEITMAKPADSPLGFSGMGNVVGMYNTSAPGNATVYFVDSVMLTQTVFDTYIGKAAPNFYAAVQKLSNEDVAVSTLLATLDTEAFSNLKDALMNTPNGTFFVPNNDAATALLSALNVDGLSDLVATEGLRKMTEAILLHHFVPDVNINEPPADSAEVTTALETLPGVSDSKVRLVRTADGGVEIVHRHPLSDSSTINATVVDINVKTTTSNGYKTGQDGSEERGSVHIIDMVMLPIPEDGVPTLKDWNDSTPLDETYNIFQQVLDLVPEAKPAITGPLLRGVIFMPSDAAFTNFLEGNTINGTGLTLANLVENPSLVKQILYEHIILDNVITDSGDYMTWNDANVTVTLDAGSVTKFARASGAFEGAQDVPTEATVEGNTPQNANGHIAQITGGAAANGRIFFVDQVIVSKAVVDRVANLASPAGGAWKTELENLGNQTFDDTLELIDFEGLESIKNLIDGTEDFTMFMPNDEALGELAGQYGLDGVEVLKTRMRSNTGLAKQMLETYIIMGDVDDSDDGQKEYPTKNGKYLTVTVNNGAVTGISVSDDSTENSGSKRKLLSSTGGVDGKASFLNGQTMFNLNGAPLTQSQQDLFNYVLNGASVTSPYMLLLASLAIIATLFSL
mmetsp:Transcript_24444/g.66757  ORF Transcript_24444/g.66757 Transcript_24444/m.66757 type:complete len:759 (-) Transcript_24444:776-3052(-)